MAQKIPRNLGKTSIFSLIFGDIFWHAKNAGGGTRTKYFEPKNLENKGFLGFVGINLG